MKTQKMSLANMKEKLSRVEMKSIMAGGSGSDSGSCPDGEIPCTCNGAFYCVTSVQECWDKC